MKLFTKIKDKKQTQTDVRGGGNFSCRHPKLWSYIKSNVKAFFITGAITFVVTASATTILHSRQVRYKNDKSVETAINELYEKAEQCKMAKIGCYGCTKLDYLESTGTQYIDTELYGNEYPNLIVEIEGNYIKLEAYQYLFGVGSKSSSPDSYILLGQNNALGFIGQIGIGGTEKKIMDADNQKHKFVLDAVTNVTTVDSTSIDMNTDNINAINYKYAIFAINNSGTVKNYAKFKMYYCKITNDNALIRDYIPVLDKNDRPCLFDKVSKECFYNQGTGEFLYG